MVKWLADEQRLKEYDEEWYLIFEGELLDGKKKKWEEKRAGTGGCQPLYI